MRAPSPHGRSCLRFSCGGSQGGGRDPFPLPPGHPLSWGLLQALLSPENRDPWPGALPQLQPGCQPDLLTLWKDAA